MVKKIPPPAEKCHFGVFGLYRPQFFALRGNKGCFCAYLGEPVLDFGVRIEKYLQMNKLEANKVRF